MSMPSQSEVLGNRTIRGKETLGVPGRIKSLHAPLPLAGRLMRVLCVVIEIAMLPMFHQAGIPAWPYHSF
jgi:hypothetical protein